MKYCTNCGQRLNDGDKNCSYCGSKIEIPTAGAKNKMSELSLSTNTDVTTARETAAQTSSPQEAKPAGDQTPVVTPQNQTQNHGFPVPQTVYFSGNQPKQAPQPTPNPAPQPMHGVKRVCKNCLTEVAENDFRTTCPFCGAHLPPNAPTANPYGAKNQQSVGGIGWQANSNNEPSSGKINRVNLVLSLINLPGMLAILACIPPVSGILAIFGLIYTINAPKKPTKYEEDKANKSALIFNLIALGFNLIFVVGIASLVRYIFRAIESGISYY